ncbi:unnamed protein product [Boreogadus saida]
MCVESDGCEIEGCSSSDEVQTLSGSMSPALKSTAELHPCKPGHKFRAALMRCRTPTAAAGILSFGNVLNYMDRCTVAAGTPRRQAIEVCFEGSFLRRRWAAKWQQPSSPNLQGGKTKFTPLTQNMTQSAASEP